jgi:hypothetical protein
MATRDCPNPRSLASEGPTTSPVDGLEVGFAPFYPVHAHKNGIPQHCLTCCCTHCNHEQGTSPRHVHPVCRRHRRLLQIPVSPSNWTTPAPYQAGYCGDRITVSSFRSRRPHASISATWVGGTYRHINLFMDNSHLQRLLDF